jgi:hypothetical protein
MLSGGLDSILAIRLMQEQDIEVEALNFKTVFTCCQDQAGQSARTLGVSLTVIGQEDDYLDLVREPKFGYGKGANPCVDCRIYMFEKAKRYMEQIGADFIISGEVVGQRPMSQKRRELDVISYHSRLDDLLLRPLSAKLLPPTLPERKGWVDREKLQRFYGRSRKGLIRLARRLNVEDIPSPSTGCALTEPRFARKVFDLIQSPGATDRWNFELLKFGRHFRFDLDTKVVVGRHEAENDHLKYMHELPEAGSSVMLFPNNFPGPRTLVIGPASDASIQFAQGLVLRYSNYAIAETPRVNIYQDGQLDVRETRACGKAEDATTIATY